VETLYARQEGRCEVTRLPFTRQRFDEALVKHPFAPSIDRRSSSGGYTTDNVRLVCVAVNFRMGHNGSRRFFSRWPVQQTTKKQGSSNPPAISKRGKRYTESVLPPPRFCWRACLRMSNRSNADS
jgi:hypothetical protein